METLLWLSAVFVFFAQIATTIGADPDAVQTTAAPAKGYQCSDEGVFPDPEDCRSYYRCTETLQAKHESCLPFLYFHPIRKGCSFGGCSILTKPNRFSPGIKTNATEQYQCTSPGMFADPKDCSSYYSCDSNLKPQRHICFFGIGHYDIDKNMCTLGFC